MRPIEQQNIRFFNFWAKFYSLGPLSWWLRGIQRKVADEISFSRSSRALDVGCGTGDFLSILSKKGLNNLAGIDLSPEMIKRAKQNLGRKATLKQASVEKMPFQDKSFDFVVNTEAFHHFPAPKKSVREMSRVVKIGGLFCIADLNFHSGFVHWLFKKLEPGHVKIYSADEFRELFEQAGLTVVRQKRIGWFVILTAGRKNVPSIE